MEIFINEWSFTAQQFYDKSVFDKAVATLVGLIDRARTAIQDGHGTMWRSQRLADVCAVQQKPLRASMNHISNREVREEFVNIVFNVANPAEWENDSRQADGVSYGWQREPDDPPEKHDDVRTTSMAELAERRHLNTELDGCLLNLAGSPLGGRISITVVKAAEFPIELASFEADKELAAWLDRVSGVVPYPADAREPPRDEQTCLRNSLLFEPVTQPPPVQGRRVYQHRVTGKYYYLDNRHWGRSAHLEVFDKRGRHEGKADLEGTLQQGTADRSRKLPMA